VSTKFEILAKLCGLSVHQNERGYTDPKTTLARIFWDAQQTKIDKLGHDLISANCAAKMFQVALDNPVVEKIEEGTPA
jgi:hypothetical protein